MTEVVVITFGMCDGVTATSTWTKHGTQQNPPPGYLLDDDDGLQVVLGSGDTEHEAEEEAKTYLRRITLIHHGSADGHEEIVTNFLGMDMNNVAELSQVPGLYDEFIPATQDPSGKDMNNSSGSSGSSTYFSGAEDRKIVESD